MQFGLFGGAVARAASAQIPHGGDNHYDRPSQSPDSNDFSALIDTVVEADTLGFKSVFLVEHHFTGTSQISASLGLLTYLAALTQQIRLGTAVVVLPWHNPVILAEQVATLDVLSSGRVDLGIGRGYRPSEFEHFCIPIEEASARFEESVELLRKSLSNNQRFDHNSANWRFKNIVVEPAPVQQPHPPFWVAAGRESSIKTAATNRFNLLLDQFATFELLLERFAIYQATCEQLDYPFSTDQVAAARAVVLVDNERERSQAIDARMRQLTHMNRLAQGDDGQHVSSMQSHQDARYAAENNTLIGTPEEVIARVQSLQEQGLDYILLSGLLGKPQQLRRFAEQVLPHFHNSNRMATSKSAINA